MLLVVAVGLFAIAWIGHACIWTAILNRIYGRPLPKYFLKTWRYLTAVIILAFPLVLGSIPNWDCWKSIERRSDDPVNGVKGRIALVYGAICPIVGGLILPMITVRRMLRKPPACVLSETTRTLDLWPELGAELIGNGKLAFAARIPGNGIFQVDFTDLVLAPPDLPREWDGLTIHVVSDLHFHGTPSQLFFERVFAELAAGPTPDILCLLGDYVDTKKHHDWIRPLLGDLAATEGRFAVLGNHDRLYDPDRVRQELSEAGYFVLGNDWREVTIRGVRCVVVGHEGPWFRPAPDLSAARDLYRLCLSHTPDNFYWGIANRIGLMLCGHVHGGAIRVPLVGSIFVPSIYGRRFDIGVFEQSGTVMAVSRGLSGGEPIRFRCNPQVLRITLRKSGA